LHEFDFTTSPGTTSRKWENAEKVAKMGILIRDLQWGNGHPDTWLGILEFARKNRNLISPQNHHTYVYIIIDLSLIPLIGGVK
jgi:hypothetical protein